MEKSKVFFLHIPKCAGVTVLRALNDIYGRAQVFHVRNADTWRELAALPHERRRSFSAVGGHGYFHAYLKLMGNLDDYHRIVTFRDPIDRAVSTYNYVLSNRNHYEHELARDQTFEQFILRGMANEQTIRLCGKPDPDLAMATLDDYFDDWCLPHELNRLTACLYGNAGKRAHRPRHLNKSRKAITKEALDGRFLEKLRHLNAADVEFYERLKVRQPEISVSVWQRLLDLLSSADPRRLTTNALLGWSPVLPLSIADYMDSTAGLEFLFQ